MANRNWLFGESKLRYPYRRNSLVKRYHPRLRIAFHQICLNFLSRFELVSNDLARSISVSVYFLNVSPDGTKVLQRTI